MNELSKIDNKWQFWVDRGGTFTDIIAKKPKTNNMTDLCENGS